MGERNDDEEIYKLTRHVLLILHKLHHEKLWSRNRISFLKNKLMRQDPRFMFVIQRYMHQSITLIQFLNELLELSSKESELLFDEMYDNCTLQDGKLLSNEERKRMETGSTSLTYGEIDYRSFITILRKCCAGYDMTDKVFIDLGSGTGRAVFAARIIEDFACCEGVELLTGLYGASEKVRDGYEAIYKSLLSYNNPDEVKLHCGSIVTFDWSHGDVVFANSTCFNEALMSQISTLAENLKPGSIVITFTKSLSSARFEVLEKVKYTMSWGPATVFFHRRLSDDASVNLPPSRLDQWRLYIESLEELEKSEQKPMVAEATSASSGAQEVQQKDVTKLADSPTKQYDSAVPSNLIPGKHIRFTWTQASTDSSYGKAKAVKTLPLLLWTPLDYSSSTYCQRPLIVFLHGASARGSDTNALLSCGLNQALERSPAVNAAISAVVVSPLCPNGMEWKLPAMCDALIAIIDKTVAQFSIDPQRIYLMGISMGGLGTWMLAARNTKRFAAIVPMCGGGSPVYARLLKDVPSWFVHSADDNVIGIEETDKLVEAMRAEGAANVHYSRFDTSDDPAAKEWMVGHNCWDKHFQNKQFWEWLHSQSVHP